MSRDRTEMNDLSKKMPEKLKEMTDQYNEWAAEMHVLPWDSIQMILKKKE